MDLENNHLVNSEESQSLMTSIDFPERRSNPNEYV